MDAREHHFVPKSYLRLFSADGRRINLFNFGRDRTIQGVSIKHQCSKRGFHDFAPHLEENLSVLEGEAAKVFRSILQTGTLPPEGSQERSILLTFIAFQQLRTTRAGNRTDVVGDYFGKLMLRGRAALKGIDIDQFSISHKYPVALPLSMAPDVAAAAATLKMHLFVNRTAREFITSDDPVVLHNQYCEGISHCGVLGWQCRGIQVVLPVSSTYLVLLFDGAVYKVGSAHKGIDVSFIDDMQDVDQWNALQILNSLENVYFLGAKSVSATERQCVALARRRPAVRTRFVETEKIPADEGKLSSLVAHYELMLPHKLAVSGVQIRREAKRVPLLDRATLYRDGRVKPFAETMKGPGYRGWRRYEVEQITDK